MCSLGWLDEGVRCPTTRPYESLLAKGEDRKQRILAVAQRLLARNGWRNTSLAQIAGEAGVSPAGLLHHFESKEQLLNAVLDARDADDDAHADRAGDLITEIAAVAERFDRAPNWWAPSPCCWSRTSHPDAPLHDRLLEPVRGPRSTSSPSSSGAASGPAGTARIWTSAIKAVQILAFITGMETTWLLDPSIPLTEVFKGYAESLARDLASASPA